MAKNCTGCIYAYWCWEDSWENGNNYCQRDNEDIIPNKIHNNVGGHNET